MENTNELRREELSKETIKKLTSDWQNYVMNLIEYPNSFHGQGIVIPIDGFRDFINCQVLLGVLKASGCLIPIEIWYNGMNLSEEMIVDLQNEGLSCKNIEDFVEDPVNGFIFYPLCILSSSYEEVLLISPNVTVVKNPEFLFYDEYYLAEGSLFWPERTLTPKDLPVWKILEVEPSASNDVDPCFMLINKSSCWQAINLSIYFNTFNSYSSSYIYGQHNTLKFAWIASNKRFSYLMPGYAICGYLDVQGEFVGVSKVHYASQKQIMFIDRTNLRWDVSLDSDIIWKILKSLAIESVDVNIINSSVSPKCHKMIDFDQEGILSSFCEFFPDIEKHCFTILKRIRRSNSYKKHLINAYFAETRFKGQYLNNVNANEIQ